jgi:uncharacterized protein
MLYALLCQDKAGHVQLRLDTRPEHLAYLDGLGDRLKLAGPFLGADGKPNGSLVIIEADDLAEAKSVAAADPYAKAGLFESVVVRPWVWAVKNPEPQD